ncbi:hypothetical protein DPMN_120233 [Dreissena polymorpha]|uniref:G-protein coupled receptors family 1 profile domain-containing protein n=1 Tax=Dreissena polymorpha TaxID=45954 RepID=A0A9D4JSI5_DREPO|nr:hypothetical protein DPMN_120233 [Dreissena polymorpha]
MTTQTLWNTSQITYKSPTENGSSSLKTSVSLVMTMSSHLLEISTASFPTASVDYKDPKGSSDNTVFGENGNEMSANDSYYNPDYEDYMYEAFAFERPIYLFIWEILVIITALVNVLVIIVLLRKKVRNPTNMILAAIAIADTLTGLVTLPTYIIVYQNFEKATGPEHYSDVLTNETETSADMYNDENINMAYGTIDRSVDAYKLSKSLCTWFMLSKFFFSKLFHTCSIFLTLFLGIQRFVSVAYPFFAGKIFTSRTVHITCVCIFILSPLIHIYHLFDEKAINGFCQWEIDDCKEDCVYLWAVFFIRHFIPIALLFIFTILFIIELRKTKLVVAAGSREQVARRDSENIRITKIVISILIVFLLPEIPYGGFLMMSVINKHTGAFFHLETNRAIHAAYEIALVVSFHVNFYIYTFLNRRFRSELKRTVLYPIRRVMGDQYRWSVSSGTPNSRKTAQSSLVSRSATRLRSMDHQNLGREAHQISQTDSLDNTETKLTNGSNSIDSQ